MYRGRHLYDYQIPHGFTVAYCGKCCRAQHFTLAHYSASVTEYKQEKKIYNENTGLFFLLVVTPTCSLNGTLCVGLFVFECARGDSGSRLASVLQSKGLFARRAPLKQVNSLGLEGGQETQPSPRMLRHLGYRHTRSQQQQYVGWFKATFSNLPACLRPCLPASLTSLFL